MNGPAPLMPWGGVKRSTIILFQLQSHFQRFLYQFLFVFSQIKDIKHIKRNFHSVVWSCSRVGAWGALGSKIYIFRTWLCGISN